MSAEPTPPSEVIRCDRCTRPATQQVKASYFREHGVSGKFCGRHAAKSGLPCVQLTSLYFENMRGHAQATKGDL